MTESADNTLGFRVQGDVTREDYDALDQAVAGVVEEHGSARILLDLTDFRWEKVDAWGADWRFGKTFKKDIDKMAIVGDRTWERYVAKLAQPFYAKESHFFETDGAAWEWLRT